MAGRSSAIDLTADNDGAPVAAPPGAMRRKRRREREQREQREQATAAGSPAPSASPVRSSPRRRSGGGGGSGSCGGGGGGGASSSSPSSASASGAHRPRSSGKQPRLAKHDSTDDVLFVRETAGSGPAFGHEASGGACVLTGARAGKRPRAGLSFKKPFDCPICMCDEIPPEEGIMLECGHKLCLTCAGMYVKGKVEEGEVNSKKLCCPTEDCKKALSVYEIRAALGSDEAGLRLAVKYEEFALKSFIESNLDNIRCCPSPGCQYAFGWSDGDPPAFTCPSCAKVYCLQCQAEEHKRLSCDEFCRQRDEENPSEEDLQFREFAKKGKMKQCPKCRFWVERSEGCNAMTCRCGIVFCYACGLDIHDIKKTGKICKCNDAGIAVHRPIAAARHGAAAAGNAAAAAAAAPGGAAAAAAAGYAAAAAAAAPGGAAAAVAMQQHLAMLQAYRGGGQRLGGAQGAMVQVPGVMAAALRAQAAQMQQRRGRR